MASEHKGVLGYGDVYAWTAIDSNTKLAFPWLVGHRGQEYAETFLPTGRATQPN